MERNQFSFRFFKLILRSFLLPPMTFQGCPPWGYGYKQINYIFLADKWRGKRQSSRNGKWRSTKELCRGNVLLLFFLFFHLPQFVLHSARWDVSSRLLTASSFQAQWVRKKQNLALPGGKPGISTLATSPGHQESALPSRHSVTTTQSSGKFKMGNIPRTAISTLGSAGLNREIRTILEV